MLDVVTAEWAKKRAERDAARVEANNLRQQQSEQAKLSKMKMFAEQAKDQRRGSGAAENAIKRRVVEADAEKQRKLEEYKEIGKVMSAAYHNGKVMNLVTKQLLVSPKLRVCVISPIEAQCMFVSSIWFCKFVLWIIYLQTLERVFVVYCWCQCAPFLCYVEYSFKMFIFPPPDRWSHKINVRHCVD